MNGYEPVTGSPF